MEQNLELDITASTERSEYIRKGHIGNLRRYVPSGSKLKLGHAEVNALMEYLDFQRRSGGSLNRGLDGVMIINKEPCNECIIRDTILNNLMRSRSLEGNLPRAFDETLLRQLTLSYMRAGNY